jgi:hypothetical protein
MSFFTLYLGMLLYLADVLREKHFRATYVLGRWV